jgi:SNF2 family DNA or RNA helicase
VVCPASLKINWKREIQMVYPKDMIDIISTVEMHDPLGVRWFIINYDILEKRMAHIEFIIKNCWVDTLILDEAHYIKGKTLRAACIVGGTFKPKTKSEESGSGLDPEPKPARIKFEGIVSKMKKVYCLTGTPLLNRPIELYNLLKAIDHPLGKIRPYFAKKYCGAFRRQFWNKYAQRMITLMDESGATNLQELRQEMKGFLLRRKKDEVLHLPQRIVSTMECELPNEWKKNYETAWDAYLDFLQKNPIPEKNIDNIMMARQLVEIQKLKQVCSKAKISRIVADIRNAVEQDEKIIVFSQYTATIKTISETLALGDRIHASIKNVTLTGEDDMDQRQRAVDAFQSDSMTKVFIANIKAGGVGINLTAASIVIFADMDWSPEIHNQAIDRAHRIGQDKMVNAYFYICPETIEEDIINILNSKAKVMEKILEGTTVETVSSQREFLKRMSRKATVDKL